MDPVKLTFLGDIMCEPRLLKAAGTAGGRYGFSAVFQNVRELLDGSDYVIGNLETPLAGREAGYVSSLFSFNAPDEFALAAKEAGIDLLLTANNHCLDRGIDGLKRTVSVLAENGIPSAGTFSEPERRGNTYFRIGDTRFALVAYTYGTNYSGNHILLTGEDEKLVNLLRPQTESYYVPQTAKKTLGQRAVRKALNMLPYEKRFYIRKWLGLPINQAHEDDSVKPETMAPYLQKLAGDLEEARRSADVVLFCPHTGGQFNREPGAFTCRVFSEAIEKKADALIASHAHVVQKAEIRDGVPCFYSLGNFSMSPNSVYLLHENLPDYGLAAHLYLEHKRIVKTTFSILKIIEDGCLTVYPADVYAEICSAEEKEKLEKDVRQICRTVTGTELTEDVIRKEYLLA